MRELDLKNTFVITLPREMANMASLLVLNLDGCPTKESLNNSYSAGMTSIHTELRRKEDRKIKFGSSLYQASVAIKAKLQPMHGTERFRFSFSCSCAFAN